MRFQELMPLPKDHWEQKLLQAPLMWWAFVKGRKTQATRRISGRKNL
jgi:hypothetical protein